MRLVLQVSCPLSFLRGSLWWLGPSWGRWPSSCWRPSPCWLSSSRGEPLPATAGCHPLHTAPSPDSPSPPGSPHSALYPQQPAAPGSGWLPPGSPGRTLASAGWAGRGQAGVCLQDCGSGPQEAAWNRLHGATAAIQQPRSGVGLGSGGRGSWNQSGLRRKDEDPRGGAGGGGGLGQ